MLMAVATARETLAGTQRFVARNLAGGVDHVVVVLDAPAPPVRTWLERQPEVTVVLAARGWWAGARPPSPATRRTVHANMVLRAVHDLGLPVTWLAPLDTQEVLHLDRAVLDSRPASVPLLRTGVREAVGQPRWDGEPDWFKRPLEEPDLALLHVLGAVETADNAALLAGAAEGARLVRPDADVWLGGRWVRTSAGEEVAAQPLAGSHVLRFQAASGEEFVEEWLTEPERARSRPALTRGRLAEAARTLVDKQLPEDTTRQLLDRLHRRHRQDDLATLRELGLVERITAPTTPHRPSPLAARDSERLRRWLDREAERVGWADYPSTPAPAAARARRAASAG